MIPMPPNCQTRREFFENWGFMTLMMESLEESSRNAEDRAAADCAATSSAFVASLQAIGILDAQGAVSPQYQGIMTRHAVQKMEGEVRRHQAPIRRGRRHYQHHSSRNHHWPAEPPAVPNPQGWSVPSWGPPHWTSLIQFLRLSGDSYCDGEKWANTSSSSTQVVQEESSISAISAVPQRGVPVDVNLDRQMISTLVDMVS